MIPKPKLSRECCHCCKSCFPPDQSPGTLSNQCLICNRLGRKRCQFNHSRMNPEQRPKSVYKPGSTGTQSIKNQIMFPQSQSKRFNSTSKSSRPMSTDLIRHPIKYSQGPALPFHSYYRNNINVSPFPILPPTQYRLLQEHHIGHGDSFRTGKSYSTFSNSRMIGNEMDQERNREALNMNDLKRYELGGSLMDIDIDNSYLSEVQMKLQKYLQMVSTVTVKATTQVIIGNQSADYDSIIGSIIFGYIKFLLFKEVFVPVIDCKRQDLKLRFEVVKLLQQHQIKTNWLRFKEEITTSNIKQLILYDHNIREDINIKPIEIVDHHFMKDKDCPRTLVGHCGSCLTLLYYMLRGNQLKEGSEWERKYIKYSGEPQQLEYDPEIDELIRAGILLDTYCLSEKQKSRWDEIDKMALQNIQKRLQGKKLIKFDELQGLKFDQGLNIGLTLQEQLVKDFKEFTYTPNNKIGYSIILLHPTIFLDSYNKETVKSLLNQIMKQRGYSAYFLMFLFLFETQYHRELLLYSENKETWDILNEMLKGKLNMVQVWKEDNSVYYKDNTNKISRKVLEKQVSLVFEKASKNDEL